MKTDSTESLVARLRAAVFPGHQRIEGLPYFAALTAGELTAERYLDQLRAVAIVEVGLERLVSTSEDPDVRTACAAASLRSQLLLQDLAFFDPRGALPDDPRPTGAALELAHAMLLRAKESPVALLGHLYVSQGMTLGNLVHRDDARACAGGVAGAAWYAGFGAETLSRFQRFCAALDALELDERAVATAVEAARTSVEALERVHRALEPTATPERCFVATTFNPEAGSHAVPEAPELVAASLRAAARCLDEFPYYAERWGERGQRYARSDVAWLTAIAAQPSAVMTVQLRWLCGVLARRGMPSLLLERQLTLLAEELATAGATSVSGALDAAARSLGRDRKAALPEAPAAVLVQRFVAQAAHATEAERRAAAELVLGAVADEAQGWAGTLGSTLPWFSGERYPAAWNAAMDELVHAALAAGLAVSVGSSVSRPSRAPSD